MILFEASRGSGAQECDSKHVRLWIRVPLEELKYLIFCVLLSGFEAKRGVEFRHSKRSAPELSGKCEADYLITWVSHLGSAYPDTFRIQRKADRKRKNYHFSFSALPN